MYKTKELRTTVCRKTYKVINLHLKEMRWDEEYGGRVRKSNWKTKRGKRYFWGYQFREYRTWKHNRVTQYK